MACVALGVVGAAVSLFGSKKKNDAAKKASDAQRQAAELQTLVARQLHEHWKNFYMACDIAAITEVCAVPVYAPAYATVQARVAGAALRDFGRARLMIATCQEHFCVTNADCNFLSGVEAQATVDAMNFGFRREEGVKEQLDQIRLENKRSFLALGRGLLKTSSDAAQLAAKLGDALKGWLGSPTQGWLEFAGFLGSPEGKRFADDTLGGIRGLFKGEPESPTRRAATSEATTIDYSFAMTKEQGVSRSPLALPAPTPVVQGEMASDGGNLNNRIGLPDYAMNFTGER
jgi:hypothetical protein